MFEHSNGLYLPHLSPSTINSFITNRFGFYQSKYVRAPFKGSAPMARGTAVENCVNFMVEQKGNVSNDQINDLSVKYFLHELKQMGISPVGREDMTDTIGEVARLAVATYLNICNGEFPIGQQKLVGKLPGVTRDILGYTDYTFINKCVRDCKVVGRSPSGLSQSYIIAGSFYRMVTQLPVVFDFFVCNKKPVYKCIHLTDDDYAFGIEYMTAAARRLEEIETCDNPRKMMELILSFPDLSAFYSQEERKQGAATIGIKV